MTIWTRGQIEVLTALWAEGRSFGEIADVLGKTRGAVAGKWWRLGLQTRAQQIARRVA